MFPANGLMQFLPVTPTDPSHHSGRMKHLTPGSGRLSRWLLLKQTRSPCSSPAQVTVMASGQGDKSTELQEPRTGGVLSFQPQPQKWGTALEGNNLATWVPRVLCLGLSMEAQPGRYAEARE